MRPLLPLLLAAVVLGASACQAASDDDHLIGGCVSYGGVDFSEQDLSGRDFTCDNLADADFTGADLSDAVLVGASTSGAVFTDVTWDNTVCVDGTNSDDHGGTCAGHLGAGAVD